MPNINDVFPSKYLKAADLGGAERVVTISRVDFEPVGPDREMKAVIYFNGKKKGMVVNKTNANAVASISGSALTEDWEGTQVTLYPTEATFAGNTYEVVRIKRPKPAAASVAAPKTVVPPAARTNGKKTSRPTPPVAEDWSDPTDAQPGEAVDLEDIPF
jgi:hypothetical protein